MFMIVHSCTQNSSGNLLPYPSDNDHWSQLKCFLLEWTGSRRWPCRVVGCTICWWCYWKYISIIPSSRCDYHLYSFFPRTVGDWNTLSQQAVQPRTVEAFKEAIVTASNRLGVLHCKMVFYSVASSDPTQRSWTMILTCNCTCSCITVPSRSLYQATCICYLILPLSWLPVQLCHTITQYSYSGSSSSYWSCGHYYKEEEECFWT